MSTIYKKLIFFINKISFNIHKTFLFTSIFSIISWIENQWINSYFKHLYPDEGFLSLLNKNKILNEYLFSPLIVLLVFGVFLLLSIRSISNDLKITIGIAFISFFITSYIFPRFLLNEKINKPLVDFKEADLYSVGFFLILIGIIFFFISVASVGGLPVLNTFLRYSLKPIFTMPVFLIIPGISIIGSVYIKKYQSKQISRSQVRFRFLILVFLSSIFLLTLGYRTPLLAVLLVMIIIGYYGKILAHWEVIIGALLGVGLIIGIGYFRSVEEFAISSSTSPFYTLQSRADFTLHVLDLLNFLGGNFGATNGNIIANSIPRTELGPRMTVGKLIAWRTEVTVTPTLLGQMVADFGIVGVAIEMGLLGFILGMGFKIMKKTKNYFYIGLYSLILTYSILGVETGILDIQVLFYYMIATFIYIIFIIKYKTRKYY